MAKKPSKAKGKELGMGLRALLTNVEEETPEKQQEVVKELSNVVATIPLEEISVNPNQPRVDFDQEALKELASSLKVHGLIQPVTVRRLTAKEYQLISGERRWRASKMAGLKQIPAYIRIANDQEMLEMALVENIQRKNLNPIEVAITYQRLKEECKLTDDKLAARVGKQRSTVTNHLRLLKLPPDIQKSVKDRLLSMGHARALAGVDDYALRDVLYRQTLREGLSVRALERLIASYNEPKQGTTPKGDKLPDDYQKILDDFRAFFGSKKVQIKLKDALKGKGQLIVPFNKVEELNQFWDKIEED